MADVLVASDEIDIFAFEENDSVTGAIDTIARLETDDVIDLSALGLSRNDIILRTVGSNDGILKLIEGFGEGDFQLKIELGDLSIEDALSTIIFDDTPAAPDTPTVFVATDDVDTFVFEAGDSVTGAIDTIVGLGVEDTIDIFGLGVSPDDIMLRTVGSDDGILKLIDGFGEGEFQLKIVLGDLTIDEALSTIVFTRPPALVDEKDALNFEFSTLISQANVAKPERWIEDFSEQDGPIEFLPADVEMIPATPEWIVETFDLFS